MNTLPPFFFFSSSSLPLLSSFFYFPNPSVSISFSLFYMPSLFVANVPPRVRTWYLKKVESKRVDVESNVLRSSFLFFLMCILFFFFVWCAVFCFCFEKHFFFFGSIYSNIKMNFGVLFFHYIIQVLIVIIGTNIYN